MNEAIKEIFMILVFKIYVETVILFFILVLNVKIKKRKKILNFVEFLLFMGLFTISISSLIFLAVPIIPLFVIVPISSFASFIYLLRHAASLRAESSQT